MTQPTDSLIERIDEAKYKLVGQIQTYNLTIDRTHPRNKEAICLWKEARDELQSVIQTLTDCRTRLSPPVIEGELATMYQKAHESLTWYLNNKNDLFGMELLNVREVLTALHDELMRMRAENEALKGAGNMFCKKCKGIIYGFKCPHCGFNNETVAY